MTFKPVLPLLLNSNAVSTCRMSGLCDEIFAEAARLVATIFLTSRHVRETGLIGTTYEDNLELRPDHCVCFGHRIQGLRLLPTGTALCAHTAKFNLLRLGN